MSSTNKTTPRGGKGVKGEVGNKSHKQDKTDTGKAGGDKQQQQQQQHTSIADQLHSTKQFDRADIPSVKDKVKQVMDMTRRSEEEVCAALHECDYDTECAVNMLFETDKQGEWETTVKKKKSRQASTSKGGETGGPDAPDEWTEPPAHNNEREKTRNKGGSASGGGPPRMRGRGHNDSRGWRGRERHENERNTDDGGSRRGRSNGPNRGGSRLGRGGSRPGARSYQSRETRGNYARGTVETWDECVANNTAAAAATTDSVENWDNEFPSPEDWYNEEYTGSLADSKVFTPSGKLEEEQSVGVPGTDQQMAGGDGGQSAAQQLTQALEMRSQQPPSPVPIVGNLTLSAAQTQYLTQLTQQNVDSATMKNQQHYGGGGGVAAQYGGGPTSGNPTVNSYAQPNYAAMNNYGSGNDGVSTAQQVLPARTKTQRARVPPPSKIPSSAVEMPGDLNSIGYLDVQFGALDFMSEPNSFDGVAPPLPDGGKYVGTNASSGLDQTSIVDLNNASNQSQNLDGYSGAGGGVKQVTQQGSINSGLSSQGQIQNEHLSGNYSSSRGSAGGGGAVNAPPSSVSSGLEMSKQSDSYSSQQNSYSYQPKGNAYQSQSYNNNSYTTSAQVSASSTYTSNQPSNNSYANSNSSSYNAPNTANSSYQNAYSASSNYQSAAPAFPSITQSGTFPANNQSYTQNSNQSVYGGSSGLNNSNSNYSGMGSSVSSTAASQYNSYNTSSASNSHNHKLNTSKDSTYDSASNATSNTPTTSSTAGGGSGGVSASPASLGLNSQTTTNATGTKVTTSTAKTSVVVTNIPAGVAPMMGTTQYIMGQTGVPYFQQPMYSYEDLQVLQQRMPHMTTGYYDMSYPTPTTLPTVRDAGIGNVSYSTISDGRFTRGDNASPVPSTLSQQTNTQHQAPPMLNAGGLPPGYTYFYNASVVPGSFQYGTPTAIYPQMPAATNAHGSSNSTQYAKPGGYGSGYASGYDALTQTQDYSKGAYVGATQAQSKASGANPASTGSSGANDISVMYGKSHAALGKVNSYEKQGFHSGTPPPFNLANSQSAGLAPSGNYGPQMYIPTMPPHQQHHSTPMMHQPLHQDSANSGGQRSQTASQAKSGAKQGYPTSYWNQS